MSEAAPILSPEAEAVLMLLRDNHNVLLSGAPGTGKTRLLREIQDAFRFVPRPAHNPSDRIAIKASGDRAPWLPSPDRDKREVFPTVFDQNTKVRDVLRGLVPVVADPTQQHSGLRFRLFDGILYRASEHARQPGGASLLVIDEISRGPAVAAFGGSIVGLDSPKRLAEDGSSGKETAFFEILNDDGDNIPYALPHDLYILAAMNQADTSVEPLDVAFIRRFAPYALEPSPAVLRQHFGLPATPTTLPDQPATPEDVYEALVQAWERVNRHIAYGRGPDYRVGHGVLIDPKYPPPNGKVDDAIGHAARGWRQLRAHINEVFFNETLALAEVLAAGSAGSPYELKRRTFAGNAVMALEGPEAPNGNVLWGLLRSVAVTD